MKPSIAIIAGLVVICATLFIYQPIDGLFINQYDDSYITYRYSINLATGKGLVYNDGERTDGASSFLYTIILAGIYKIGIHDLEVVSGVINLLSLGLITILVFLIIAYFTKDPILSLILSILTGLHGFMSGWAIMAMDTIFFTMLLILFVYLVVLKKKWIATIVLCLLILTRFEAFLLMPFWIWVNRKNENKLWRKDLIIPIIIVTGLYFLLRYIYYGSWLPNAMLAKNLLKCYSSKTDEILISWGLASSVIFLLSVISISIKKFRQYDVVWLWIYIMISCGISFIAPYSDLVRYTIHLIPLMVICGSFYLTEMRKWTKYAIIVLIAVQMIFSIRRFRSDVFNLSLHQKCRKSTGESILKSIPTSDWIICVNVGYIGYVAINHRFIDLFGITSQDVMECYKQGKNIDSLLFVKHPKYIADNFKKIGNNIFYQPLYYQMYVKKELPEVKFNKSIKLNPKEMLVVKDIYGKMLYFGIVEIEYK